MANQVITRKKALDLGQESPIGVVKAYGYKVIDTRSLQQVFRDSVICAMCRSPEGKLELYQDNSKRNGLHECLLLRCEFCKNETQFQTSKKIGSKKGSSEVNIRLTQGGILTGNGQQSLNKLCTALNLPQPVTIKSYQAIMKKNELSTKAECEIALKKSSGRLGRKLIQEYPSCQDMNTATDVFSVAVSIDGTWQKRYGYSSLLGVIFLMSMETGEVLDFEVRSKVCFECRSHSLWDKNSDKYKTWFQNHKDVCAINHYQSSEAMKKEAATLMFMRSIQKHNLKYTTYVGDGDSSSYGVVSEALFKEYGSSYLVLKEDCVGHIQKRMGTNLRSFKNKSKGRNLADGGGVGGRGRLTDSVIDSFQNYFGYAIRNNSNNLTAMHNAVWAIYYHCIAGESESLGEQHKLCPDGENSWCRYKRDVALKTNTYTTAKCLPPIFREELKGLFERLSDKNLLQRCLKGYTQNQNESINNSLWVKCPKRVFVGSHRLETATAITVLIWNRGAASMGSVLERIGVEDLGINTMTGYRLENLSRIKNAAVKCQSKYRRRRRQLRHERKTRNVVGKNYLSGAYGTSKQPEVTLAFNKRSLSNNGNNGIQIVFVDEKDIEVHCEKKSKLR